VRIPNLRQWRELRGLTQQELADHAGLSVRGVAGYEAGAPTRPHTARKLAEALDVDVMDLAGVDAIPKGQAPPSQRTLFEGFDEERRTASFDRAARRLEELVVPFEAKLESNTLTDEDRAKIQRADSLITPFLQVALEAEASFLRQQYPDEYDVGPYAVLGPAIVRFVAVLAEAGGEANERARELEETRVTAYGAAA
jgi:transcriptional regulator with XRE-family HTH domain